jgi:hypothetical protein
VAALSAPHSGVPFVSLTYDSSLRLPSIDLAAHQQSGVDFSDLESQRVLEAAATAVARELGREAARQCFAELISGRKTP